MKALTVAIEKYKGFATYWDERSASIEAQDCRNIVASLGVAQKLVKDALSAVPARMAERRYISTVDDLRRIAAGDFQWSSMSPHNFGQLLAEVGMMVAEIGLKATDNAHAERSDG